MSLGGRVLCVFLQRSASSFAGGHGLARSKCAGSVLSDRRRKLDSAFYRSYSKTKAPVGVLAAVNGAKMSTQSERETAMVFRQVSRPT